MALYTQIVHHGEPLTLNWGYWHVDRMIEVATTEEGCEWKETQLATTGRYVVNRWHGFIDESDGEILEFNAGDILIMHH